MFVVIQMEDLILGTKELLYLKKHQMAQQITVSILINYLNIVVMVIQHPVNIMIVNLDVMKVNVTLKL